MVTLLDFKTQDPGRCRIFPPHPRCAFIWLFLICILQNKTVVISIVFLLSSVSRFSRLNPEGSVGGSQCVPSGLEVWATTQTG